MNDNYCSCHDEAAQLKAKVKDLEAKLEAALSIPPDARGKMMVLDAVERAEAKVKELEAKLSDPCKYGNLQKLAEERAEKADARARELEADRKILLDAILAELPDDPGRPRTAKACAEEFVGCAASWERTVRSALDKSEKAEAKVKELEADRKILLDAMLAELPDDPNRPQTAKSCAEEFTGCVASWERTVRSVLERVKAFEAKVQTEHELYLAAHRLTMELATKNVELTKRLRLKNGSK